LTLTLSWDNPNAIAEGVEFTPLGLCKMTTKDEVRIIMQKIDKWYQELANGIVLQAVDDYRKALNGEVYSKNFGNVTPEYLIVDCERFFRSKYFHLLTKVDGEYLIQKLRREHEEKVRKEQLCTLS
jgi:hypothetical protein